MNIIIKYIGFSFLFAFFSCGEDKHVRVYKIKKAKLNKPIEEKISSEAKSNFEWDLPKGWKEVSGHSMRIASFQLPGDGDLSITSFSGASGGVKANVNRWENQIGLSPSSIEEIKQISENRISRLGNYQIFELSNEENKDLTIIAAIFPLKGITLFVKLSIKPNSLNELREQFVEFCDSIRNVEND